MTLRDVQPERPRRTMLIIGIVVLAVIALAAIGALAFTVGRMSNASGEDDPTPTPTPTSSSAASDPTTPVTSESSEPAGPTAEEVAQAIDQLFVDSARDKDAIRSAAEELASCGDVQGATRTFADAKKSRFSLAKRALALDTSSLPEAQPVVRELALGWQFSAQADGHFADAGRLAPCDTNSVYWEQGLDLSARSHPHKEAAAELWRPIARDYGLQPVKGDEF